MLATKHGIVMRTLYALRKHDGVVNYPRVRIINGVEP